MKYGNWKVFVSLAKIANFHVLGLFIPSKPDALVGRVNTFIILYTKEFKKSKLATY
jgi:hypothetical protein